MTSIKSRIASIDLLRGAVMIIMALDHARDFLHYDFFRGNDPLNFATTSTTLFLTRWITHFCAPVFVFLAGASISFSGVKKTKTQLSLFLFTRGLWLIVLELTLIYFGWMFNPSYKVIFLQVIWAIGGCMVVMAGFVFLPRSLILITGLLIVFGHNTLDVFDSSVKEQGNLFWSLLHQPGKFLIAPGHSIIVAYPILPWLGLMMIGYAFAQLYSNYMPTSKRKHSLIILGTLSVLLFVALRSGNFYGDAWHWKEQKTVVFTALSFIDCTKYPPSLLYLLMTIGPALIILAFAENLKGKLVESVSIIGRVPLFYYILHIYLLHTISAVLFFATGHSLGEIDFTREMPAAPENFGFRLWQVYLIWFFSVSLLYFPCKWYNNYKSSHSHWWLSYL